MLPELIPYFDYRGSALPGNAEVVVIFATAPTTSGGAQDGNGYTTANWLQTNNIHRIYVNLQNDQSGILKAYQSQNRGVTWVQVVADISVSASAANSTNDYDFNCEPYKDYKITWTNGATPQTTFRVNVVGIEQRAPAT